MTKILTPADCTPAALRAIAADLRAADRPVGERAILAHVAAQLEDMVAAKEMLASTFQGATLESHRPAHATPEAPVGA